MKLEDLVAEARDTLTVHRVFGEPYETNGVTFIPAAAIRGGGGGGEGDAGVSTPGGRGGGFGMTARPIGAYRISNGEVKWIPATDATRMMIGTQVVAVVALLVVRSILKVRWRRS